MLFIVRATTFHEAWTLLSDTYVTPSHGCIKQVKIHLKNSTMCSSQSVIQFFQYIKACANELAILGALWMKKISPWKSLMVLVINTKNLSRLCKLVKLWSHLHNCIVYNIFVWFKAIVEKHFDFKIIILYYDNDNEYQGLAFFLGLYGISHRTSPLHISEHNECFELRHQDIVEIGLSLLSHASLSLQ